MSFIRATFAAIAGLAFVGTASAQSDWVEIDDEMEIGGLAASADDVEDMTIHDEAGNAIGEVEEVLGTEPDTASALVVDFEGASAYRVDGDVIVTLDQFTMEGDKLTIHADPNAVATLEGYTD